VLSGRGLCDELITRPEESYRLWCVVVCDLETSRMKRPWPALGCSATGKNEKINPLNAELNPICYLLALLGAHHFLHVSRIRVKVLLKSDKTTLHANPSPFIIISRSIILRLRNNFQKNLYRKSKHILCSIIFSRKIRWKIKVEPDMTKVRV